jgi:hypothetical protein
LRQKVRIKEVGKEKKRNKEDKEIHRQTKSGITNYLDFSRDGIANVTHGFSGHDEALTPQRIHPRHQRM